MHPIGIDTGGTFTDAVIPEKGGLRVHKVSSTPADPSQAIADVLDTLGGASVEIRHGTTVATNAVLTRSGARVCLVTDQGFEDILEIGRGTRRHLFELAPSRPAPLVERRYVLGVPRGAVAFDRLARRVARSRAQAVAIGRLHALTNAAGETGIRNALATLGLPLSCSSELSSDGREVERIATAVLNAYVQPLMQRYLHRVADLPGCAELSVLRSDGGRMSVALAAREPVRTLLSGPAAGVAAVQVLLRQIGREHALSFDVGGTSTDVAWVEAADMPVAPRLRVGEHTASIPSVGIETIGAGGGSLIDVDSGGALTVGPASAGADPGPACYGKDGPFTLTDAWLLSGRLPSALAGGCFTLDPDAARAAAERIARRAGLDLDALCLGASRVAAMHAARALRQVAIQRGRDPRDAPLVAFGGAGPQLACETAEQLGIAHVLVPPAPGVMAALGAWQAPHRAVVEQRVAASRAPRLEREARRVGRQALKALGLPAGARTEVRLEVAGRYPGQVGTLTVPLDAWPDGFHAQHARVHGFERADTAPEPVLLRARAVESVTPGALELRDWHPEGGGASAPRAGVRVGTAPRVLPRSRIGRERRRRGPLRIDEASGTTWVPAGWRARAGGAGCIELERQA